MRYFLVRARLRPGEKMLSTEEGARLLEKNLGRPKCRYGSSLYAYRVDRGGIELLLGLPHSEKLTKIMHRVRTITTTEFNRARGTVGTIRWERGFESTEIPRTALAKAARRTGRTRVSTVALDPIEGP